MNVDKRYVFERSGFDPLDQGYEYWLYEFSLGNRRYRARRYVDSPDEATILHLTRWWHLRSRGDVKAIARYLTESEGVKRVVRLDSRSDDFERVVEP